jgi:hypothetical protein
MKLRSIKPRVDTNPPKQVFHSKSLKKSSSFQSLKSTSINLENQILLKKMYEIDSRPASLNKTTHNPSFKSLNRNSRIKNLTKISEENQNLLSRLQRTKSSYCKKTWEKDHKFKTYLKSKLSQNGRHIPRVASFSSSSGFLQTSNSHPQSTKDHQLSFRFKQESQLFK